MARASPTDPNERRAEIMAATERLIVALGGNVSTRAIAEAVGIAEGTIFRAFPTKEAIIDAIFEDAFDRTDYTAALAAIDLDADLEARMIQIVAILQQRIRRLMALFGALGVHRSPVMRDKKLFRPQQAGAEIAAILEPDRDRLRLPPADAARVVQAIVAAQANPLFGERSDDPATIVDLILNGIARHPAPSSNEAIAC